MKLLILSAWYHPFIHPRAHRWTALAEYWAAQGDEVHVLTARVGESEREAILNRVQVHRVGFDSLKEWVYYLWKIKDGRGRVGAKAVRTGWGLRILEWLYKATWKRIFFPDDACVWFFPARRKMFQLLEDKQFDALITVSLPFTDHLLGLAAKRRHPDLHWLADIGDPFSFQVKSPNNAWLYKHRNHRLERQVLESADAVSVTTDSVVGKYGQLFGDWVNRKLIVIPPLFVPLASPSYTQEKGSVLKAPVKSSETKLFKLGYFGAFYAPTRTPDALLDLLDRTFQQRPDLTGRLSVHFYGEVFPEFYERLSRRPSIHLQGLHSRAEAWSAMLAMDILLNIGNTTDFQLPSKAVDYLASGLPVLNISYVKYDPFAQFFQGNPMVFSILVKNNRIPETEMLRWIEWLEAAKPELNPLLAAQNLSPFLVESIANKYSETLRSTAPE